MSKSSELYLETVGSHEDDKDYEYFEWLTNKQWQDYLEEERLKIEKKYRDAPATLVVKWGEFLLKNHMK